MEELEQTEEADAAGESWGSQEAPMTVGEPAEAEPAPELEPAPPVHSPAGENGQTTPGSEAEALSVPEQDRVALEGLAAALFNLDDRLRESQRLLARQSELAGNLHTENQRLRAGELRAALLPLVRDLLRLHDDIGRIAGDGESGEDLELIRVSLLDALARNGIAPVQPAQGERFDPKRHNACEVVETAESERDRSVAGMIRTGFEWEDGQTIRVADVSVYRCVAPALAPSATDECDTTKTPLTDGIQPHEEIAQGGTDRSGGSPAADEPAESE